MPVIYGGKKIIPGPFVNITKTYADSGGNLIGQTYKIVLNGKIVAHKGSPDSTGAFWTSTGYPPDETIAENSKLAAIERKIEALKKHFKTEGQTLEWASADGSTPLSCNPRIKGMTFQDGPWVQTCDFSVELEADQIYGLADADDLDEFVVGDTTLATAKHIESYTENWSIQEGTDARTFRDTRFSFTVTHTISAVGKRHYEPDGTMEKQPWQWAEDFCTARSGDWSTNKDAFLATTNNPSHTWWAVSGGTAFITARSVDINESQGGYSITETYYVTESDASGAYYKGKFNIVVNRGANGNRATISGEHQGLGTTLAERQQNAEKSVNDAAIFTILNNWVNNIFVPVAASEVIVLNPQYLNKTITNNLTEGAISYSYEYDDRYPATLIDAAGRPSLSESVSFSYSGGTPVVAEIFCLGRFLGPVFQSLGTRTTKQKTMSINAIFRRQNGITSVPDVSSWVSGWSPITANGAITQYVSNETTQWNAFDGQLNYSITWNYE